MRRAIRRLAVSCALATAALAAAGAPAGADIHGFPNFNGTCSLGGTASFAAPLQAAPGLNSFAFTSAAPSTCTGALAWGPFFVGSRAWPVAVTAANSGVLSCAGSALPNGAAKLTFLADDGTPFEVVDGGSVAHRLEITVLLDTVAVGSEVALVARGGSPSRYPQGTRARGTAHFAADQATVEACAGPGVDSLSFTASVTTGPSVRSNRTVDGVLASTRPT